MSTTELSTFEFTSACPISDSSTQFIDEPTAFLSSDIADFIDSILILLKDIGKSNFFKIDIAYRFSQNYPKGLLIILKNAMIEPTHF